MAYWLVTEVKFVTNQTSYITAHNAARITNAHNAARIANAHNAARIANAHNAARIANASNAACTGSLPARCYAVETRTSILFSIQCFIYTYLDNSAFLNLSVKTV
jgi:hypothetical protein